MDANKILQQYVLIKPNTMSFHGHFDTPLQPLGNMQVINRSNIPNDKLTNNYQIGHQQQPFGAKADGKKPRPLVMSKRNARERRRVKMINLGYETLRLHVPGGAENKKLSKVDTLRRAVDYIKYLQTVLDSDEPCGSPRDIKLESQSSYEEEVCSQSSEAMLGTNTDYSNISQGFDQAESQPSAEVNTGNNENEVFIDIASWLLKTPNNFKSNIRLKGKLKFYCLF